MFGGRVLDKMGKPHIESYKRFCKMFYDFTGKENKDQYVVPYLMSSHPGSTLSDAVELALFCKRETFTQNRFRTSIRPGYNFNEYVLYGA